MEDNKFILVANAGSSSIKTKLYPMDRPDEAVLEVTIEKIGLSGTTLVVKKKDAEDRYETLDLLDYSHAATVVTDTVKQNLNGEIVSIGHRIVHGGTRFSGPEAITNALLADLRELIQLDPEHMPGAITLIESLSSAFPGAVQVGCFDTAFYTDLPKVAQRIAIPRRFEAMGMRRYGFHGISYTFLLQELARTCGEVAGNGRVIFAHLGSGVSLTATKNGEPQDTTMGMTPASGVMMSTRSGDIDPGLLWQLNSKAGLGFEEINKLLTQESGLLGVSETSADMYELLQNEESDPRAAEAVELFCYQIKKAIGSLAAVLGGVDTIVFAGGMGENAPLIRARVLGGLEFLGVELHADRNLAGEDLISTDESRVGVHIIHTDESDVIVQQVIGTLTDL